MLHILFRTAALSVIFAGLPLQAQAQPYPSKSIRLVCPFPPGGAVDITARAIATELSRELGQTVVVENKPGAGGNVGGAEVARAAPDGYTMMITTSGINGINPSLYAKMAFDPNKDLTSVVSLVSLNNVLVVHPSVKVESVADVIALAKSNPGKINYASSGNGTSIHMSGEMFKHLAKVDMTHIPYKGSGPAKADLLGGQVMMMFDNIPSSITHIRSGKLRAIATTGTKRDAALPDLPTIAETGISGYEAGVWYGLLVPAATPKEIISRLNEAGNRSLKSPDFLKRMTDQGFMMLGGSPEQMSAMMKEELTRWAPIVKASGAKLD